MSLLNSVLDVNMHSNLLNWPPFYTIQEHQETKEKQLQYWSQIIHDKLIKKGVQQSSLEEMKKDNIFINKSTGVEKKMRDDDIKQIFDYMDKIKQIQYQNNQNSFYVFKYSIYQMSDAIYEWAKNWHKINQIETLQWIINGDDTEKTQIFYQQPEQIVIQAIKILEENGKALVYELEPNQFSIKFQ